MSVIYDRLMIANAPSADALRGRQRLGLSVTQGGGQPPMLFKNPELLMGREGRSRSSRGNGLGFLRRAILCLAERISARLEAESMNTQT